MRARVSACTRWNTGTQESRRASTDYLSFDQLRHDQVTQEDLYATCVQPFVARCLQGYCGSIITYGGWGSGKSYTLGTLDPQLLTLMGLGHNNAGVLPRCIQQLYQVLGPDAALEITCVEVQGDDIVDLLDPRVCPPLGRVPPAAAVASSSPALNPGAGSGNGLGAGTTTRSPMAAGGAAGAKRKSSTLVVARSLPEALLCLKHAFCNRQAFVTTTRHSSSRTHAVIQLRWLTPATLQPAPGSGPAAVVAPPPQGLHGAHAPAPFLSGGRTAPMLRPYTPRAGPPGASSAPAAAARGVNGSGAAAGSSVCVLTLVDTCSSCPLLPPKEGSAVKRSLLALSRVLVALQRRQSVALRESKLTRMLEGAVDQVLVLACLGGSGDEATVQLVKMLQQGTQPNSGVPRSRRASSSDSPRMSSAWEEASQTSLCSVSARSLGPAIAVGAAASAAASTAPVLLSRHPSSHLQSQPHASVMILDHHRKPSGRQRSRLYGPSGNAHLGGCDQGQALVARGDHGHREGAAGGGGGLNATSVAHDAVSFPVDCEDEEEEDVFDDGCEGAGGGGVRHLPLQLPRDGTLSSGGGASSSLSRFSSAGGSDVFHADELVTPPLLASAISVTRHSRESYDNMTYAAAIKLTATGRMTAARAASLPAAAAAPIPTAAVRHVDLVGFDPAHTPGSMGAARRTNSGIPGGGVDLTGSGAAARSRKPPGLSPRPGVSSPRDKPAAVSARAAPGPEVRRSQGFSVLAGKWAPPPPLPSSGSVRTGTFPVIPHVLSPRNSDPYHRPPTTPRTAAGAPAASTALRKAPSGIASRPPSRAPQPSPFSFATRTSGNGAATTTTTTTATAAAAPSPRLTSRPSPRSAIPSVASASGAPVVSLTTVRPTPLASTRYGSASVSHDGVPEGIVLPAAPAVPDTAPGQRALAARAMSPTRMSLRRQPSSGGGGAVTAAAQPPAASSLVRRSISSGTRWPSPLLRARRDEWLAEETRRSRSALPRPAADREGAPSGTEPRRTRGWRCAPLGRPTLSSQYKDLLMDFEAFKAKERTPRRRCSGLQTAAPPPPQQQGPTSPPPAAREPLSTSNLNKPDQACEPQSAAAEAPFEPMHTIFVAPLHLAAPVTAATTGAAAATQASSQAPPPSAATGAVTAPIPSPRPSSSAIAISTAAAPCAASRLGAAVCPKLPFARQQSPPADEGLMSLTAAAAVAAASPRTPGGGGLGATSGRSRPGVNRCGGMQASPRYRCSPDTVIPTVVLDMSRLSLAVHAGGASAASAAAAAPGSARGASRLSGGGSAGPLKDPPAGDAGAAPAGAGAGGTGSAANGGRGGSDSGSDPMGSDSELGNLLGPCSFKDLNRMLHEDAVLRQSQSMSPLGAASGCMLTPRQRAAEAAAAEEVAKGQATSRTAAAAAAMAVPRASPRDDLAEREASARDWAALSGAVVPGAAEAGADGGGGVAAARPAVPSETSTELGADAAWERAKDCAVSIDTELPAVSFFIHQSTPCSMAFGGPEWGSSGPQNAESASGAPGSGADAPAAEATTAGATVAPTGGTLCGEGELTPQTAVEGPLAAKADGEDSKDDPEGAGSKGQDVSPRTSLVGLHHVATVPTVEAATAAPASHAVVGPRRRMDLVAYSPSSSSRSRSQSPPPRPPPVPQLLQHGPGGEEGTDLVAGMPLLQRCEDVPARMVGGEEEEDEKDDGPMAHMRHSDQARSSVGSAGVLRGSCTPFAVDSYAIDISDDSHGTTDPGQEPEEVDEAMSPRRPQMSESQPQQAGTVESLEEGSSQYLSPRSTLTGSHETAVIEEDGNSAGVEGSGAVDLRGDPGNSNSGVGADAAMSPAPRSPVAVGLMVMQLGAHVRPNHSDLDEQSVVLVGVESGTESEVEVAGEVEAEEPEPSEVACRAEATAQTEMMPERGTDVGHSASAGGAPPSHIQPKHPVESVQEDPDPPGCLDILDSPRSPVLQQRQVPPVLSVLSLAAVRTSVRKRVAQFEAALHSPTGSNPSSPTARSAATGPVAAASTNLDAFADPHLQYLDWAAAGPEQQHILHTPSSPPVPSSGYDAEDPTSGGSGRRASLSLHLQPSSHSAVAAAVAVFEHAAPRDGSVAASLQRARSSSGGGGLPAMCGGSPGRSPRLAALPGRSPLGTPGRCTDAGLVEGGQMSRVASQSVSVPGCAPSGSHGGTEPATLRPAAMQADGCGVEPAAAGKAMTAAPEDPVGQPGPSASMVQAAAPAAAASGGGQDGNSSHPTKAATAGGPSPGPESASPASPGRTPDRSPERTPRLSPTATPLRADQRAAPAPGRQGSALLVGPNPSPRRSSSVTTPRSVTRSPGRGRPIQPALSHGGSSSVVAMLSPERLAGLRNKSGAPDRGRRQRSPGPGTLFGRSSGRSFGFSPGRLLGLAASRNSRQSSGRAAEAAVRDSVEGCAEGAGAALQAQQLRSSSNVAASWRAAAVMSTSSSSVRSCFRSSVGQQLMGADAVAVATATVVAVGRPPAAAGAAAAVAPEKAQVVGMVPAAAHVPPPPLPMLARSSGSSRAQREEGSSCCQSQPPAPPQQLPVPSQPCREQKQHPVSGSSAVAATPVAAASAPGSRPSGVSVGASPVAAATTTRAPAAAPAPASAAAGRTAVPPLALAAVPKPVDGRSNEEPAAAAKSARRDGSPPLSARLRRVGSGKSSAAARADAAGSGVRDGEIESPPPPAYPPGFISWAAKLFSSVKGKCAS